MFSFPVCHWSSAAGATSYIQSIQQVSITIASGSTSNTATISSVNTSNAIIIWDGSEGSDATNTQRGLGYLTLTNSTTVTATRGQGTSSTCTVKGVVIEFTSAAIAVAAQYGTITIGAAASSNTATLGTSVNKNNSIVLFCGQTTTISGYTSSVFASVELTNGTTVTAARSGTTNTAVVSFCVVELNTAIFQSIQHRSPATFNTTATAPTDTITSVNTANTILLYGGFSSANAAPNSAYHYLTLTNATTVTFTRQGTAIGNRNYKYVVLEFKSGILNSSVQRGTIDMNGAASNTATISSVSTSKAFANFAGMNTDVSSTTLIDRVLADCTLTNGTTVTANKNTAANQVILSYEVPEFV